MIDDLFADCIEDVTVETDEPQPAIQVQKQRSEHTDSTEVEDEQPKV